MSFGKLTALQKRLVSLAHGLVGAPQILIMEDLFQDLSEAEVDVLESILELELADVRFIAGVNYELAPSRRLVARSDAVLMATSGEIMPPVRPSEISRSAFWVTSGPGGTRLHEALAASGANVTRTPDSSVLLVRNHSGRQILSAAAAADTTILALSPLLDDHIS